MNLKALFFLIFGFSCFAKALSNEEIVFKYIPDSVLQAKDTDFEPPRSITKEMIKKKFIEYNFGSKDGTRYLLATYSNQNIPVDKPKSVFLIIKILKNGVTSVIPAIEDFSVDENTELTLVDLDNDNISELVTTNLYDKGFSDSEIFKWTGTNLKNITDEISGKKSSLLSDLQLNSLPALVFTESIPPTEGKPAYFPQKIRQLTAKGVVDLGTFDFIKVFEKSSRKVFEQGVDLRNLSEGNYQLEVKNLSKHARSVRAEIWVNDVFVLKPTDFCHGKPKLFKKQKDKKGNEIPEDDDDDDNEDQCKRCDPRKEIYANVNLKAEDNSIRVKLFGNKNSKLQITLKKK